MIPNHFLITTTTSLRFFELSLPTEIEFICHRFEIVKKLVGNNNIGIELGVAEGNFSFEMMI